MSSHAAEEPEAQALSSHREATSPPLTQTYVVVQLLATITVLQETQQLLLKLFASFKANQA